MKNNFLVQALLQSFIMFTSLASVHVIYTYYPTYREVVPGVAILTCVLLGYIFQKVLNEEFRVSVYNVVSYIFFLLILITLVSFLYFGLTQHTTSFNLIISNSWNTFLLPLSIILAVGGVPLLLYMWIRTMLKK